MAAKAITTPIKDSSHVFSFVMPKSVNNLLTMGYAKMTWIVATTIGNRNIQIIWDLVESWIISLSNPTFCMIWNFSRSSNPSETCLKYVINTVPMVNSNPRKMPRNRNRSEERRVGSESTNRCLRGGVNEGQHHECNNQ